MVTTLAAMAGAPDYNYDYTATGQVTPREPTGEIGNEPVTLWVHAGTDEWALDNTSPITFEVAFHVIVTAFVGNFDESVDMDEVIELIRFDIVKAVLNNTNLGGTCTYIRPLRSAEPGEDTGRRAGVLEMEFVATLSDLSKSDL
jgi:hypothetical protein